MHLAARTVVICCLRRPVSSRVCPVPPRIAQWSPRGVCGWYTEYGRQELSGLGPFAYERASPHPCLLSPRPPARRGNCVCAESGIASTGRPDVVALLVCKYSPHARTPVYTHACRGGPQCMGLRFYGLQRMGGGGLARARRIEIFPGPVKGES